ncbi:MAG TPA: hypothetical protein VFE47_18555 [Tepidisphaeraceae bacterium]|jgi:hypothetical protein|nr:hypothetical protein [Tepidisphaeraceae bacterium]
MKIAPVRLGLSEMMRQKMLICLFVFVVSAGCRRRLNPSITPDGFSDMAVAEVRLVLLTSDLTKYASAQDFIDRSGNRWQGFHVVLHHRSDGSNCLVCKESGVEIHVNSNLAEWRRSDAGDAAIAVYCLTQDGLGFRARNFAGTSPNGTSSEIRKLIGASAYNPPSGDERDTAK